MSFLKPFVGLFGGFLLILGVSILFGVLFLSHFAAQEAEMDSLLDETFALLLKEDSAQVTSVLEDAPELEEFFAQCNAGTLSIADCTLTSDNPYLSDYFSQAKEGWKTQVAPFFGYLDPYMEKRALFLSLGVASFLFGAFLLFFSLGYDKYLFFRKLFGKLGIYFLFLFSLVFFLLHLQKQDLLSLFEWLIAGAPEILYSFVSMFLFVFIGELFQVFFYPLLILSIFFIVLWLSFWIYSWILAKGKLTDKR